MSLDAPDADHKKKKSPLRMIILVGGILALEAVVIIGAMMLLGGPPPVEAAEAAATLETPESERIVEILVLDARLTNNKSGVTYLYGTEIYVQVKRLHSDRVSEELEQFRHEIKSEITAIWRTAEARHFQEPRLETLTRRVRTMLTDRFGVDHERDEPIISKCVIVMGMGFRIES